MADGAVAHVGTPARQAVGVVGERFQVLAPALTPEAPGDGAPLDLDGLDVLAFLAELVHLPESLRAARGYRDIPPPFHCAQALIARISSGVSAKLGIVREIGTISEAQGCRGCLEIAL